MAVRHGQGWRYPIRAAVNFYQRRVLSDLQSSRFVSNSVSLSIKHINIAAPMCTVTLYCTALLREIIIPPFPFSYARKYAYVS